MKVKVFHSEKRMVKRDQNSFKRIKCIMCLKSKQIYKRKGSFISILTGISLYYNIFAKLSSMKVDFKLMSCERKMTEEIEICCTYIFK